MVNRFRSLVLLALLEIGGFADEVEIGSVDYLKGFDDLIDGLKNTADVTLVDEDEVSFASLVCGSLCMGDVILFFEADPDHG